MRLTTPAAAAAASLVALLAPIPVHSFNPSWKFVGGFEWPEWVREFTDSNGFSLAGQPHEDMTRTGVYSKYPIYFDIPKGGMTPSMHSATQEIVQGSMDVDDHVGGVDPRYRVKEAEAAPAHCDDEKIGACQKRLQDMRDTILSQLKAGDVGRARNNLGRALHTLQDFYSHSNWVELGLGDSVGISKKLGVGSGSTLEEPGLEFPIAPEGFKTCENCTYPSDQAEKAQLEWIAECRRSNVKGGDPMDKDNKMATAECQAISTFGPKVARTAGAITGLLGRIFPALTIPNILLSLAANVAEALGHGEIYPDCKRSLRPELTAGPQAKYLTTGYFGTEVELGATWKKGKCSHGGLFDRDARGREGIGKDASAFFISPRADLHFQAASLAVEATKKYLDDVKDTICGDEPASTCVLLKTLYGVGPTLAFVIDTTGSMGGVIAAVQEAAVGIVNNVRDSKVSRPSLYILAPFNDPVVPPASVYTDPDQFIRAILALRASGGWDCPELAMGGLSNAVAATPAGGKVFLWTDAGAKDESQAGAVAKIAKAKSVSVMIFKFASGGCDSPAAYDLVAPGRFYDGLSGTEAASTASYAEALILNDSVDLVSRIHPPSFPASPATLGRRATRVVTLDVPVDDSVSSVGFSANTSTITMSITRPDGSAVLPGDPGVTNLGLKTGKTIIVDTPAPGTWKVTLSGDAAFSFNSFAKTNLLLPAFNFVEQRGTHHEGLFPVLSPPAPGSNSFVVATMAGDVSSASFEFRSPGGELLSHLDLSRGNGTDGLTPPDNVYYGPVTIPTTAFFVYVRGNTATGRSFVRVVPGNLDLPFGDGGGSGTSSILSSSMASSTSTGFSTTSSSTLSSSMVSSTSTEFSTVSSSTHTTSLSSSSMIPSSSTVTPSSSLGVVSSSSTATSGHSESSIISSATSAGGEVTSPSFSSQPSSTTASPPTSTSSLCPTCQPPPCVTPITSLTHTIIYLTSDSSTTHSVTTTLDVPCYAHDINVCKSSTLPVICPGSTSLPVAGPVPVPSIYPGSGVDTSADAVVSYQTAPGGGNNPETTEVRGPQHDVATTVSGYLPTITSAEGGTETGVTMPEGSSHAGSSATEEGAAQSSSVVTAGAVSWVAGGVRAAVMMGLSLALAFTVLMV